MRPNVLSRRRVGCIDIAVEANHRDVVTLICFENFVYCSESNARNGILINLFDVTILPPLSADRVARLGCWLVLPDTGLCRVVGLHFGLQTRPAHEPRRLSRSAETHQVWPFSLVADAPGEPARFKKKAPRYVGARGCERKRWFCLGRQPQASTAKSVNRATVGLDAWA